MWTDKKIQSESNRAEQGRPLLVEGTYWEKERVQQCVCLSVLPECCNYSKPCAQERMNNRKQRNWSVRE